MARASGTNKASSGKSTLKAKPAPTKTESHGRTGRPRKLPEGSPVLNVVVSRALLDAFDATRRAHATGLTLSALVRALMQRFVDGLAREGTWEDPAKVLPPAPGDTRTPSSRARTLTEVEREEPHEQDEEEEDDDDLQAERRVRSAARPGPKKKVPARSNERRTKRAVTKPRHAAKTSPTGKKKLPKSKRR